MIVFRIPTPPSANRMWANRKGGGKRLSPEYDLWLSVAGWEMKQQTTTWKPAVWDYHLNVTADVGRLDLDNAVKPINDLMQKMGVVTNDRNCKKVTITDVAYTTMTLKENECLVIIKPMEKPA